MLILTMVCEKQRIFMAISANDVFYVVSRDTTAKLILCGCVRSLVITYIVVFITLHYPKREPKNVSNFLKHNFVLTILKTQEKTFGEA